MGDGLGRIGRRHWPWLAIGAMLALAVWHAVDFPEQTDADFPGVVRPYFSPHPPAAYRLAEPGDTLDRVGLYLAAAALTLSLTALARIAWSRRAGGQASWALWPSAVAVAVGASWYASTPGPTFDGWHGLGWRTIFDPAAPLPVRTALTAGAVGLLAIIIANLIGSWPERRRLVRQGIEARVFPLLGLSLVLVGCRQWAIPGLEPVGYWQRCSFDLGLLAYTAALVRLKPTGGRAFPTRAKLGFGLTWGLIVGAGVALTGYHRPLARLRPVVPGRIYISAMPTYRGLSIEQERLGFKTIINLFDEASTQASPYHAEELRFVREHGLRYLGSSSEGLESDRFLNETFALAQDPDAWPILVHCHGCMDRSPAWMGMYRFLFERKPLASIFAEIEQHRGTQPKAVVTLQYNRKLPKRAPEQFASDPTGAILLRSAAGTTDPLHLLDSDPTRTDRQVVRRIDPDPSIRRP